jgi:hypothetical protein
MSDITPEPWMLDSTHYKSAEEIFSERAQQYRSVALLGYGALLVANDNGKYDRVIALMEKTLWPTETEGT